MEFLVVVGVMVIAFLVMSSIGSSIPPAQPTAQPPTIDMLMAERGLLITKIDLELQAAEIRLRSSGLTQAAEGAALTRARAIEFLKGYK